MWATLRAELVYFRPVLLTAWAIAAGVSVLVNVLTLLGHEQSHPGVTVSVGLPGILLVVAAMVVAFIAQGTRSEERRTRLLFTAHLTPPQIGAVLVLLPACLVALGVLFTGVLVGLSALWTGGLNPTPLAMVAGVAGQLLAIVQMGPLAQESTAALRQGRRTAAVLGWAVFVGAILLLAAVQVIGGAAFGLAAQIAVAVVAMATSASLYAHRTDLTR